MHASYFLIYLCKTALTSQQRMNVICCLAFFYLVNVVGVQSGLANGKCNHIHSTDTGLKSREKGNSVCFFTYFLCRHVHCPPFRSHGKTGFELNNQKQPVLANSSIIQRNDRGKFTELYWQAFGVKFTTRKGPDYI